MTAHQSPIAEAAARTTCVPPSAAAAACACPSDDVIKRSKRRALRRSLRGMVGAAVGLAGLGAHAQITTDGSVGAATTLPGPNYNIGAALGRQVGANLLHSFGTFNLGTGEQASFSGPGTVRNILARVTGGNTSSIDGQLRSEIAGANLFLLNPAGVVFGPNASIDLSGSFFVSSANYLRLADGTRIETGGATSALLTASPPAAFGFLSAVPGRISFNGSRLNGVSGAALGVIGGEITLAAAAGSTTGAQLNAPGGALTLIAAGSAGEVTTTAPDFGSNSLLSLAPISLQPGTQLSTSAATAGAITLRGSQIDINGARLLAIPSPAGQSGGIDVGARSSLTIGGTGVNDAQVNLASTVSAATGVHGGGAIRLQADRLVLGDSASIVTGALAGADTASTAGTISLSAGDLAMRGAAVVQNGTVGAAAGGPVALQATRAMSLTDGARVRSTTSGTGAAGEIRIDAASITMNNAQIDGSTTVGGGAAAAIAMQAPVIDLANQARITASSSSGSPSGAIDLRVGSLNMSQGASIASDNAIVGPSGQTQIGAGRLSPITITASGDVSLSGSGTGVSSRTASSGAGSELRIRAAALDIRDGASLFTQTFGTANGSQMTIEVDRLRTTTLAPDDFAINANSLAGGRAGAISISARESVNLRGGIASTAQDTGPAGEIVITTPLLVMANAVVQSRSNGDGDAGRVMVNAGRIQLVEGARLSSGSGGIDRDSGQLRVGVGRAGEVVVSASDSIEMSGRVASGPSGFVSQTFGSGDAGRIVVSTPSLVMSDQAGIIVGTAGSGRAGVAELTIGNLSMSGGAAISSATAVLVANQVFNGTGAGGDLRIDASGRVELSGALTAIVTNSTGPGRSGNIAIGAHAVSVRNGARIASASTGTGDAGNLRIEARDLIVLENNGSISTSARLADGGNIVLKAPNRLQLNGSSITAAVAEGGNGGNITIDPDLVILMNASTITAQAQRGAGGNIAITITNAGALLQSPDSTISASSAFGVDGVVDIKGPEGDILGRITRLPAVLVDAGRLLAERCAVRAASPRQSSFVVSSRGGLPPSPADGLMASALDLENTPYTASTRSLTPQAAAGAEQTSTSSAPTLSTPPLTAHRAPVTALAFFDCSAP